MANEQIRLPEHVLMRDVDEQVVLLDLRTETYFTLDGSAVDILGVLLSAAHVEAAIAELVETFEVDAATLREDLASLIAELAAAGLIQKTTVP